MSEELRDIITLVESKSSAEKLEIVDVGWGPSTLAPVMSANTVRYHLGKLAHGYAERFNKHEGDRQFNYAGAMLHNMLFTQYRAPRTKNEPNGPIGNLIRQKYKSWDNFVEKFTDEALKLQGSGWVYLSRGGEIKTIQNHQMRQDILVLVDMWEHAYNLDYGSDKKRYLQNIWRIMDWSVLNTRYMAPYRT